MGKFASEVPTRQNVDQAIAELKPSKREAWQRDAQEKGWTFEDFVIEKIRKNIEHRSERHREFSGAENGQRSIATVGDDSEARIPNRIDAPIEASFNTSVADGTYTLATSGALAAFGTQQLEEELASRRRKRLRCGTGAGAGRPKAVVKADDHQTFFGSIPPGQKDEEPDESCFEPPPSGGAASRADGSFTRTISFVTANENADHIRSFDTLPPVTPQPTLPSPPVSPFSTATEQDSFPTDIQTQDWRDFLESSQADAGKVYGELNRSIGCNGQANVPSTRRSGTVSGAAISEHGVSASIPVFRCDACETEVHPRAILCESCSNARDLDPDLSRAIRTFNLCDEQSSILRLAARGQNIFYTGAAGTGKSQVLRAIVAYFTAKRIVADVISPTGITALNINGRTIHSFAGWNVKSKEYPLARLRKNARKERNFRRLRRTEVLVIDEISMVSNNTLTRLDNVMRAARSVNLPFGGAQTIITGDFYQIPPVKPFETCLTCGKPTVRCQGRADTYECQKHGQFEEEDKWAFRSEVWLQCAFVSKSLNRIHRQMMDPVFSAILNKLRIGTSLSTDEERLLRDHETRRTDIDSVKIYPLREEVTNENRRLLRRLNGHQYSFGCIDGGDWNEELHPGLEGSWNRVHPSDDRSPFVAYTTEDGERHRFEDVLKLKVDMPVILLTNVDLKQGLVNGKRGMIVAFEAVEDESLAQHLAWLIDQRSHGQYCATEIRSFIHRARTRCLPVVKFEKGETRCIYPHCEVQELGIVLEDATQERLSLRSRTQIPLAPGWAITTHKSQGMTLDHATVDLSRAFEPGMPYVALSRVRGLEGLKVIDLATGRAARASESVRQFMMQTFGHHGGQESLVEDR